MVRTKLQRVVLSLLFIALLIAADGQLWGQSRFPGYYAVYFTDKQHNPYQLSHPEAFLSGRSLERRKRQAIAVDSSDLPPSPAYIDSLRRYGVVKHLSRWQNSALTLINDTSSLLAIEALPFVKSTTYLSPQQKSKKLRAAKTSTGGITDLAAAPDSIPHYGASSRQLSLIGLPPLHQARQWGQGILIAILDAGFYKADKMEALAPLRQRGGIVATRDFVLPGNDIYGENSHGQYVLGTMAAYLPDKYIGSAPGADFLLLRTEDVYSEYPVEEYYWLAGAEYADSTGADILTSSLSYFHFDDSTLNHSQSELDGNTTIVSRAAGAAASKGILVFTSAGNEGNHDWRKIGFPADAKGIITVGAVDSSGEYASLSSQGYSADGRIKPELAAVGRHCALISASDKVFYGNGTSFSTPTLAGAAAVLMQANPGSNSKTVREALLQSGTHHLAPDSLTGYGIPDLFVAHLILNPITDSSLHRELSFNTFPNPCTLGFYLVFYSSDTEKVNISLWDTAGKQLFKSHSTIAPGNSARYIDALKEADAGVYFIRIQTGEKTFSKKIIKQ